MCDTLAILHRKPLKKQDAHGYMLLTRLVFLLAPTFIHYGLLPLDN